MLTCRSKWKQLKRLMGKCSHAFILQTYLHLRGSPRGVGTWASQALWRVSFLDELLGLVPRLWDCLAAPFSSGTGSQGGPPTSLGNREERRASLCSPSATHTCACGPAGHLQPGSGEAPDPLVTNHMPPAQVEGGCWGVVPPFAQEVEEVESLSEQARLGLCLPPSAVVPLLIWGPGHMETSHTLCEDEPSSI